MEQLKKFGITTLQDDTSNPVNDENPAAMALGAMTQGVTPLEMALAYASFPGEGKVNTPICYYKVEDREGKVILEGKSEQHEAINEGVAFIMRNVLQSVITRGIAGSAAVSGAAAGGKTGTTNAAGHCLILLAKDSSGNPYIAVIMRAEDGDTLYSEMTALLEKITS